MTDPASTRLFQVAAPGKRVCFWGAPAHVASDHDLVRRLEATGANTGNLFIGHGLFHGLDCAHKAFHPGFAAIPAERLHEHFDVVFVPASNFVGNGVDLTAHADYFARTKLPIFCFGLGSQLRPGETPALKPGTERFLRLMADRSGSIGVRGAFTAEVLWDMGIRNTSITGCPSMLGMRTDILARLAVAVPSRDKVALNFSNNVRRHALYPDAMRISENALFQRLLSENAYYIIQNERPELDMIAAMMAGDGRRYASAMQEIATLFGVSASRSDLRNFLERRMRVFFSVEDWVGCMETMSAAIGSRFHGNVAALLAGTPALFLVHDMRTRELCELMRLPHVLLDREVPVEEILERAGELDYAPFIAQFARLTMEWRLFLDRNGLGLQFHEARAVAPVAA
ncbi:polysaccharide pyruvyl transferase family protein [Roseomonas sp. JC162]|uniref:Polysaccharide pyruvyl transferase family protein n=1 Tax=Neoroseomonas marina TaxID=1232220 RepID=A0A848EIY2_9PROT|nr:polysaccharide pyruvyl transferase family protein [Neoroseomonas marina]NMJ43405.1 polysaccharide pyruvyl transferase family protein [Neoroseomonas marina]